MFATLKETNTFNRHNNGENYNHKIKDVPAYSEVVASEGDQFQHTFSSEQNDKHQINPVQNVGHFLTLVISLHHHGDHVEADKDHDADIKDLFGYEIKDHPLEFVLQKKKSM